MAAVRGLPVVTRVLGSGETKTSVMTAFIGLGIAAGAVLAGKLSRGEANPRIIRAGLWGIVLSLAVISLSWKTGEASASASPTAYRHLLGFAGSLPVLAVLGMSAGFFAIPLQVFIQSRPPDDQKGRMVAVMNQANFLAILLSGVAYKTMNIVATTWDLPRSSLFAMMSLIVLPLLVGYHPRFTAEAASKRP